ALRAKRLHLVTVERQGATWLLQGLDNLAHLARRPSIAAWRGALRGQPAIVVSPGPSLSKNIRTLAELQGRAVLIAGTHALTALSRAGIVPDVAIAADAGDLSRHYEGVDLAALAALAVGATCRRASFELPVRRIAGFASNGVLDDWIFDALGDDA